MFKQSEITLIKEDRHLFTIYDYWHIKILVLLFFIDMTLTAKQKRGRPSSRNLKRNGLHQKHTNHFMKTYWPYLPLFVTIGVGVIIFGAIVVGPVGAILGSITVSFAAFTLII
jgi:hypothetical protein